MKNMLWKLRRLVEKPALAQGSLVLLDQGFLSIATFAVGAMLARAASKDQYSVYVLGFSLIQFWQGFPRALVNVPFTVYAARLDDSDRNAFQGSGLIHTLVLCALVVLAAYLLRGLPLGHGFDHLIAISPLLAFVTCSLFLRDFIRNTLLE